MEKHQNEKNNSVFLFGFLLGITAALLFTTKKGRHILRTLADHGLERLGDWEEIIKDVIGEDDFIDGDFVVEKNHANTNDSAKIIEAKDSVEAKENQPTAKVQQTTHVHEKQNNTASSDDPQATARLTKMKFSTRRFFKGIKKVAR